MFGGVSLGGGGGAAQLRELRVYVALGDSEKAKNYVPNMFQFGKGELEKLRENDPAGPAPRRRRRLQDAQDAVGLASSDSHRTS